MAAYQTPPSLRFSRQQYWSGVHCLLRLAFIGFRNPGSPGKNLTPGPWPDVPSEARASTKSDKIRAWDRKPLICLQRQRVFVNCSVQFSSVAQLCPALCDPMNCSTPGLPAHHQPPESTQTHVHWVSDEIQPSHTLLSPSPPTLDLSQH